MTSDGVTSDGVVQGRPMRTQPVRGPEQGTAPTYDALSRWYRLAARSEAPLHRQALDALAPAVGEDLLEVGPGTGEVLVEAARSVGPDGSCWGIDVSCGMLRETRRLAETRSVRARTPTVMGDGARLPIAGGTFHGVLMCFVLERFSRSEMPLVLRECARVLQPAGRLVVASLADRSPRPVSVSVYLWAHEAFPTWIDCRPIDVAPLVVAAGFEIDSLRAESLWGLPVDLVRATKPSA